MPPAATMTSNPSSATTMKTTTMTRRSPTVEAYWKSVKVCIAKVDGSAAIHYRNGRVELIGADGRPRR